MSTDMRQDNSEHEGSAPQNFAESILLLEYWSTVQEQKLEKISHLHTPY